MGAIQEINGKMLKLQQKKNSLVLQEKKIIDDEKKKRVKQFAEIGKLAFDADIDRLDRKLLLGAFLEISSLLTNTERTNQWYVLANNFESEKENLGQALIIAFDDLPSEAVRSKLKDLKFKWNKFRGEYYGYGDKKIVSSLLESCKCKIEIVSNV